MQWRLFPYHILYELYSLSIGKKIRRTGSVLFVTLLRHKPLQSLCRCVFRLVCVCLRVCEGESGQVLVYDL